MFAWLKSKFSSSAIVDSQGNRFRLATSSRTGIRIDERVAFSIPAFRRGMTLVAEKFGSLDLDVYRRLSNDGRKKDRKHPGYRLFNVSPNEYQTPFVFQATACKDLFGGNHYSWIERDELGFPINLWRLDPGMTFPVIEGRSLEYGTVIDGRARRLAAADVFHVRALGDGWVGYGIYDLMRDAIGVPVAMDRYKATFFKNDARPTYVIKFGDSVPPEVQDEFIEDWSRLHKGLDKDAIPALPPDVDIKEYGGTLDDLALDKLHGVSLIDVSNIVGIPASFLGSNVNTSYASLESDARSFLANTMNGPLTNFEQECNLKLLTEKQKQDGSHYFQFERRKLEETDIHALTATLIQQRDSGIVTTNEVRSILNESRIEEDWADRYILSGSFTFADELDKPEPEPPPAPEQPQPLEDDPQQDPEAEPNETLEQLASASATRLANRINKAIERKGNHDLESEHGDIMRKELPSEVATKFLNDLQDELNYALPEQVRANPETLLRMIKECK